MQMFTLISYYNIALNVGIEIAQTHESPWLPLFNSSLHNVQILITLI